jgi:hypothetical protein
MTRDPQPGSSVPAPTVVRIGVFSTDPSACDAFHAFDPESGIIYPAINDSLVYLDCEGASGRRWRSRGGGSTR